MKWYRKSAGRGYAPGQYFLGKMYFAAQYRLGQMYALGEGVPQNYSESTKWHRMAAESGGAYAQYNLSAMYALGQGVPRDVVQAYKWISLAVSDWPPGLLRRRTSSMTALGQKETFAATANYVRCWGKSRHNQANSGHPASYVRFWG